MIQRNLGTTERVLRLIAAIMLTAWVILRGELDGPALLGAAAAAALYMNVFFSRCYLWALLGINSCDPEDEGCSPKAG